jgi:hypothetical protein
MEGDYEAQNVTVAGTGSVLVAPEGTAMPADLDPLDDPWVDLGYITSDGVKFTLSRDQEEIDAWQSADPVRVLVTKEPKTIAFDLLEFDQATVLLVFRGGAWAAGPPPIYTPPTAGASDVRALVVDGFDGTDGFRFCFPRVSLTGDVEFTLQRTDAIHPTVELSVLASETPWQLIGDLPGFAAGAGAARASSSKAAASAS